jgi:NAD dependent epimerase/dehydratase family enzyme
MTTILITGGTGLIGKALSQLLIEKGYNIIILSRTAAHPDKSPARPGSAAGPGVHTYGWDPDSGAIDPEAIRQADYIVHLAGAGVADRRWSTKRKKVIE